MTQAITQSAATATQAATQAATAIPHPSIRYHYMDNLRALAMLAGILFHVALAYSPMMHNIWFTSDTSNSAIMDFVSFFLHLFRMPIFFLISGFFALMLIEKRGLKGFIKNRAVRILAPFVIFLPLVAVAVMGSISWALANVENQPPLLTFIAKAASGETSEGATMRPSTIHLWFLSNLFMFCLVTAALVKVKFFESPLWGKWLSAKSIILLMPLLIVPALVSQPAPHPAPDKIHPELWSLGFYGIFFLLGNLLFMHKNLLETFDVYKNRLLVVALMAYGFFYYQLPAEPLTMADVFIAVKGMPFTWQHLLVAIAESYAAVYLTIYCLLVGKKWLNRQNRIFRFFADASYWVYLVHVPLLLQIQFMLLDIQINMWLKFIISTVVILVIGVLSYILMVRWTPIGTLLNGKRHKFWQ